MTLAQKVAQHEQRSRLMNELNPHENSVNPGPWSNAFGLLCHVLMAYWVWRDGDGIEKETATSIGAENDYVMMPP